MMPMPPPYFSYLLRIWKSRNIDTAQWFASLESPTSHEVIYFQNLRDLLSFIQNLSDSPKRSSDISWDQDREEL